ncbi:hypothetical protein Yalta_063 [Yalta virus]|nr:hypothetical protein Yalta_063 [Yalta virus]
MAKMAKIAKIDLRPPLQKNKPTLYALVFLLEL